MRLVALLLLLFTTPASALTYTYTGGLLSTTTSCSDPCMPLGFSFPGAITAVIDIGDVPNPSGTWNVTGTSYTTPILWLSGTLTLTNGIVTDWHLFAALMNATRVGGGGHSSPSGDSLTITAIIRRNSGPEGYSSMVGQGPAGTWSGSTVPIIENPLPGALPLFMTGLGLLCWFARRRRRAT